MQQRLGGILLYTTELHTPSDGNADSAPTLRTELEHHPYLGILGAGTTVLLATQILRLVPGNG